MQSKSSLVTKDQRRSPHEVKALRDAYLAVFRERNATKEQADAVFVDIIEVTGYHKVAGPNVSDGTLRELNGSRRVGGHIMQMFSWPREMLEALEQAVTLETEIDAQQGD